MNGLSFYCVILIALICASTSALAQVVPPSKILGDWEVAHVLPLRTAPPPEYIGGEKAEESGGYAVLLGLHFEFGTTGVGHGDDGRGAMLITRYATRALPMRAMFEGERTTNRPKLMRPFLLKKTIEDYGLREALGPLADKPITLYAYDFQRAFLQSFPGSWFAAVGDVLLLPDTASLSRNWLLVLRRVPTTRDPAHEAFCKQAMTGIDKAICEKREFWLKRRYVERTTVCAQNKPIKSNADLDARIRTAKKALEACEPDDETCIWQALDAHSRMLGSYTPITKQCVDGEYKDLP